MWNIRTKTELQHFPHDSTAATYLGHYDRDMEVLFTANSGGTSVEIWQLNTQAPYIALLNTYRSASMFQGSAFMPKLAAVDVKGVRTNFSFKLNMDSVIPIEWAVPRKRKEFFQVILRSIPSLYFLHHCHKPLPCA
jgi:hypothetical protein